MCSNQSIVIENHRYSDKGENDEKVDGIYYLYISVFKVKEEGHLHQNNLVAVVSFRRNVLSINQRNRISIIKQLKWKIDHTPIEKCANGINDDVLSLDQRKGEIVFVMTKDSVEVIVGIIFIEDCINQNFSWCEEQHEYKVIEVGVGHGPTES
jgi:hypothetical protein|tara:strand:- start:237 stop:695 length:459 start_codon:yes stop_codon:yes gene_type:complete